MSTVALYRSPGKPCADHLVAQYGQAEEFEKALPGLIGPVESLLQFKRFETGNGTDEFYTSIFIVRKEIDGTISRRRFKVVGL